MLVGVTVVCLLFAWWAQEQRLIVEAKLQVNTESKVGPGDEFHFQPLKHDNLLHQIDDCARSSSVLIAALRDPSIAHLDVVKRHGDPVQWLTNHLEVDFQEASRLLMLRLRGREDDKDDLIQLVDAIARSLCKEVAIVDRRDSLARRDEKMRRSIELKEKIQRKLTHLDRQARQLGEESVEVKLGREELDVLRQVWRKSFAEIEADEADLGASARVVLIKPPTARSE